jgi:hypothetical protein
MIIRVGATSGGRRPQFMLPPSNAVEPPRPREPRTVGRLRTEDDGTGHRAPAAAGTGPGDGRGQVNGGRRLGRIRLEVAERPATLDLVEFAQRMVVPGSTIRTDGAMVVRRLGKLGYTHEYATGYNAPDPTAVLPGVQVVAALLKRWLTGTLHYAVADQQLPHYLDEYTFRFNRRTSRSRGLPATDSSSRRSTPTPHPCPRSSDRASSEHCTKADTQNSCSSRRLVT